MSKTKFYVDLDGNYIGGFQGCIPGVECVEVDSPPDDVRQKWDFVGYVWLPIERPAEELMVEVRAKRNALLSESDYLLTPDYPITSGNLAKVKVYRQALRDVPAQSGFPSTIMWPVLELL